MKLAASPLILAACTSQALAPDELTLYGFQSWGSADGYVERGGGEPYRAATSSDSEGYTLGLGLTWSLQAPPTGTSGRPIVVQMPVEVAIEPVAVDRVELPSALLEQGLEKLDSNGQLGRLIAALTAMAIAATAWFGRAQIRGFVSRRKEGDEE